MNVSTITAFREMWNVRKLLTNASTKVNTETLDVKCEKRDSDSLNG